MNTGSRLILLVVTLLLCQCLKESEGRRTTSTSRRGQSGGRYNYGNPSQGPTSGRQTGFSFFGLGTKKASSSTGSSSSGSSSSSSAGKKSSSGWISASQASKTSGQTNPAWGNPHYTPSAPKQPSNYGWVPANKKPEVSSNQFQKSSQPSSNIGSAGYPVQSGFQPANTAGRVPQQSHGYNTGQPSHGYNAAQQSNAFNTAHQPPGYNSAPPSHGFNTGQQPHGYNPAPHSPGYHAPPPSYSQPSYASGSNFGGYHPSNNYGQQGFASSHGIPSNHYPSQSSFGYPGQGIYGGSHGPKYGGMNVFGGSTGNFGYPGSSSWGYPSYGSKSSSGKGKLLTGLALGAAGGYLTSSLVNRVSNPWGYSGAGYGSHYGYDRPIIIKEIRETTKTETPAPAPGPAAEPDPTEKWIHCVAFDPTTNITVINPNCSCTVTTVIDPMTNLPISTHNCTTANGQVLPPQPIGVQPLAPMAQLPPNAVNNPNAYPSYGGLYQDSMRYGAAPPLAAPYNPPPANESPMYQQPLSAVPVNAEPVPSSTTEIAGSSTVTDDTSTTEAGSTMMNDSPGVKESYATPPKVKEFYSQLEQIVNMGKFN